MAFVSPSRRTTPPVAAITIAWRGVPRTLRLGRGAALALLGLVPFLAAWYFGATAYFVFHDQLLAALISRQTDIQYSYEDRIAALRTQLDRETSRALVERQTLDTTIQDLSARAQQLAARAITIDGLVRGLTGGTHEKPAGETPLFAPPALPSDASAYDLPSQTPTMPLDGGAASAADPRSEDHSELTSDPQGVRVAALLASIEARQAQAVARLRDPMVQDVERLRTALADTGLPLSHWKLPDGGTGGPFVPLPEDDRSLGFEANVALLKDTVSLRERLVRIIDRVPLRRPIDGAIEVTSPFGARLDPFFGRPAMHTGLDLMESYGGQVLATAAGTVTVAGSEGGYGNMVEIDHGGGLVTRYAHLSAIEVTVGMKVGVGQLVGRVGSTGRATGPHLHYETRINGEPVDPMRFLKAGAPLFRQKV